MKTSSLSTSPGLRKRQAGYTLIELSISLAIIAVLLVGTLTGVQRLLGANNANNTISQTQAALTNITKLYSASSDASIYDHVTLAQMGVWDKSAVTTTGSGATLAVTGAKHPFGGSITVYKNATGFSTVEANKGYWYRLNKVPGDNCASVATSFVNTADGIYITKQTATTTAAPTDTTGAYRTSPTEALSSPKLATGCNTVDTDGTVTIHLYIPS